MVSFDPQVPMQIEPKCCGAPAASVTSTYPAQALLPPAPLDPDPLVLDEDEDVAASPPAPVLALDEAAVLADPPVPLAPVPPPVGSTLPPQAMDVSAASGTKRRQGVRMNPSYGLPPGAGKRR
jgi:hypothetical protein